VPPTRQHDRLLDPAPPRPAREHNIGDWPSRWARRRPDALALADDERRLSWSAFEARVARAAGWLDALGVGAGDRVAILLRNRTAYLELLFAAARIGAITLPINLRLAPREIAYMLDDCRPCAVFHEAEAAELLAKASAAADHRPRVRVVVGGDSDAYESQLIAATPYPGVRPCVPDDPVILMYTSGTTGSPKGALLPHRKSLYNSLNAALAFGIEPDDRVLVVAPLFHSLGLQILAIPVLHGGGGLILQSHFEPERVWECVASERISYFGGVPSMHQRLYDTLRAAPDDCWDLESLRFIFTAGSAVSVDLIRAFEARGLVLEQGYGQTESSTLCCLDAKDAVRKAGSVGLPVHHCELRIVTRESRALAPCDWRDVAVGETGELVVRGPITMLGYWENPEATDETLIDAWLCTGDLARIDDEGYVTLVGRARDMFISGGENVYPAEVEAVLREHPSVREIAVVGVPDERWGEVGRGHVLLEAGHELDAESLTAWARERLAAFKLPKTFVVESELPRTESGKIKKHELAQ
jgi:fatty-acyl-CoA synthase